MQTDWRNAMPSQFTCNRLILDIDETSVAVASVRYFIDLGRDLLLRLHIHHRSAAAAALLFHAKSTGKNKRTVSSEHHLISVASHCGTPEWVDIVWEQR